MHAVQPDCLVNGRVGNDLGDYASTRDNVIPAEQLLEMDWETPATINDTWGYRQDDHNWKSTTDLIRKLVDITSKGGNYLLNVGPTAEGVIPQPSVERLEAIGRWLQVNGEAVYGTRAGPLQGLDWCRTTARGNTVYLHVLDWPAGGQLWLPPLPRSVSAARLLADPTPSLRITQSPDGVLIQGPANQPDPADTVLTLTLSR